MAFLELDWATDHGLTNSNGVIYGSVSLGTWQPGLSRLVKAPGVTSPGPSPAGSVVNLKALYGVDCSLINVGSPLSQRA